MTNNSDDTRSAAAARAPGSLTDQINDNLRRVYDETLNQEIPDRFKLLLEQLRAKGDKT